MISQVIVDTGPLVAFFNKSDKHHLWCKEQFGKIAPPLLTCEAVIAETAFILSKQISSADMLFELFERNLITISFGLTNEHGTIRKLISRYKNVPMSLADACLVRMSEQNNKGIILTLDQDFLVYRRHGRQVIPTLIP